MAGQNRISIVVKSDVKDALAGLLSVKKAIDSLGDTKSGTDRRPLEALAADVTNLERVTRASTGGMIRDWDHFDASMRGASVTGRLFEKTMRDTTKVLADAGALLSDGNDSSGTTLLSKIRRVDAAFTGWGKTLRGIGSGVWSTRSHRGYGGLLTGIVTAPLKLLGGMLGAAGTVGSLGGGLMGFGNSVPVVAQLTTGLGALLTTISPLIPLIAAFGALLLVWPTVVGAAVFVINALGLAFTTLAAIVVASLGPLGVFTAIIGGVGLGAVLGFQNALKSAGPQFAAFRKEVGNIKDSFTTLTKTLAADFMPWFTSMGHIVQNVLGYFNQLATIAGKSGLDGVFKSLSSGGIARLNKDFVAFVQPIGHLIQKTIAFAFGRGGREGQSALTHDFAHLSAWASKTFAPIVKWFDKQHFTKTGERWLNEIMEKIENSAIWNNLGDFIKKDLKKAGTAAADAFASAMADEIKIWMPTILMDIVNPLSGIDWAGIIGGSGGAAAGAGGYYVVPGGGTGSNPTGGGGGGMGGGGPHGHVTINHVHVQNITTAGQARALAARLSTAQGNMRLR